MATLPLVESLKKTNGTDAAPPPVYTGLSSAEAQTRLAQKGPNDPTPVHNLGILRQIVSLFLNPLVIILLIASGVSAILGDVLNAAIIVCMVLLSVAINFVQTYRSQKAAQRLRDTVAPTATILRNGQWCVLPRREVVPGDIIRLAAGDLIPADARLIESRDLHVQEAALTGESLPAEKHAPGSPTQTGSAHEAEIFLGTSVISGTAIAEVTATGRATTFGDIAKRLTTRPPQTEFERGTQQFGLLITRTIFILVLFVVVIALAFRRDAFESLLFAVALAVGLTPEFLPMITAVTLSQGAVHMARQKVIVKNLAAMQDFGSIDILCSDKTGTLTSGAMVLDQCIGPFGHQSDTVYRLAYLNSFYETGIRNPLDAAIIAHAPCDVTEYQKCDEIPFDFERRRLSIVVEAHATRQMITKGAPESVLAVCTHYAEGDHTEALSTAVKEHCIATYQDLGSKGYRVLAVAYRPVPAQTAYAKTDETGMTLAGFLTFFDPPRADAAAVLQALANDGIAVKILSGDNERIVQHLCTTIGLENTQVVLGDSLDALNDDALAHVAEQRSVFARVSPAQKNRIILALKHRGHVVGFLGDGINDAPSLRAADVGISVNTAVDVAKDAADIILMERDLRVLHTGIIEGRKAFGNVMKYLLMGTSSNFGNMFSMAGAFLFLPFLPMLPTQILLNNFLYDLAQVTIPTDTVDATFMHKPRRWDVGLIRNFMIFIGPISSIYDFLTFFIMLNVFHASESLFQTGWFVESLATQTMVVFIIRTARNPLHSRPSLPLTVTVIAVVCVGVVLPFSPLAGPLGFTPLPLVYFLFLVMMVSTYLLVVEVVKRRLMRHLVS